MLSGLSTRRRAGRPGRRRRWCPGGLAHRSRVGRTGAGVAVQDAGPRRGRPRARPRESTRAGEAGRRIAPHAPRGRPSGPHTLRVGGPLVLDDVLDVIHDLGRHAWWSNRGTRAAPATRARRAPGEPGRRAP